MNRKTWQHNDLAEDLAIAKGSFFLDVPLGSVWFAPYGEGVPRADLVEIKPSYTRFCVSIYEVKVSRADFLSDIKSGKWRGYLPHCHRIYFATPAGLVDKKEIPYESTINQINKAIREGLGEEMEWWPVSRLVELARKIKEKAMEVG